ncbi:MAG: SURF1 family cytochrome oxidase biogenesis protein [Actinomycetota bacterium]
MRPRILIAVVLALVVAGVCVKLGFWQLDRLHGRRDINTRIRMGLAQPARPLSELLAEDPATALGFRQITVTGTYDTADEVILYGRTLDGRNGNHVLTPLRPSDGGPLVIVDRGWVPFEMDTPPVGAAAPPSGTVTVTGALFPPDATGGDVLTSRTVSRVDLTQLAATLGEEVLPMYVLLAEQDPTQPNGLPRPAPLPELTEGPHLSYALQWFAFATIAIVGLVVLVRRDLRDQHGPDGTAGDDEAGPG